MMEDVSMTGARMTAPHDPLIRVGTQVVIAVGGSQGLVEIRRIQQASDPACAEYGVQFIQLESDLQQMVERAVVAGRQS
jgi:PilZ domain